MHPGRGRGVAARGDSMSTRAAPVAITGMGVVCALGRSTSELARGLFAGEGAFRRAAAGPWPLAAIDGFEWPTAIAETTAGSPDLAARAREVGRRAPSTVRFSISAALEAWVEARAGELPSERVGLVVAGNNINQGLVHDAAVIASQGGFVSPRYGLHFLDTDHVGSLSAVCGIRGEVMLVGASSASGNVGILQAARLLRLGVVDSCLVVAAPSELSAVELRALADLGALSVSDRPPQTACRPFDADRDGFVRGQGAGALFVERCDAAEARGVPVLAEIGGGAIVSDANHLADPSVEAQVRAMSGALADARLDAGCVDLLSAHATSSRLGDEIEAEAVRQVLAGHLERVRIVATKGLVGHCLNAAGAIEAIAAVLQMQQGRVHGNRNLERTIAPDLRLVGPDAEAADIETVLSSSFAFGGIHTAVVLRRGSGPERV